MNVIDYSYVPCLIYNAPDRIIYAVASEQSLSGRRYTHLKLFTLVPGLRKQK